MRCFLGSIGAVLTITLAAAAQGQPPAENLDGVLRGWEKAMTDLRSFAAARVIRSGIGPSISLTNTSTSSCHTSRHRPGVTSKVDASLNPLTLVYSKLPT